MLAPSSIAAATTLYCDRHEPHAQRIILHKATSEQTKGQTNKQTSSSSSSMMTTAPPAKKILFGNVKDACPTLMDEEHNSGDATTATTPIHDLNYVLNHTKASGIAAIANNNYKNNSKPVVEVQHDMTPLDAAKVLWENKILGAPVWDKDKQSYVGFFDMRDLLSAVIVAQKEKDDGWLPSILTTSYLAARNPFGPLYNLDSSLLQICQALCQNDAHRVPLVDPTTQRCVRILSQSAIVKFLALCVTAKEFPALEQTLGLAKFPYKKQVVQAVDTASARQVFALMDQQRLSGIAIVDHETGKHIGNTSAVDIKLAIPVDEEEEDEADMDMDILSYLSAVRQERAFLHDQYPCAHVRESSTVGHALKLLAKTGFHRVFVIDNDGRPVGVISVTDIVKFVVDSALAMQGK